MNRAQLAAFTAERTGLAPKQAKEAVTAVLDGILHGLAVDGRVSIDAFGTWSLRDVSEGFQRNPQDGGMVWVPAHKRLHFRPSERIRRGLRAGLAPESSKKRPKGSLTRGAQ